MTEHDVTVVHWGRFGGGPRFTLELARALRTADGVARVRTSTSSYAELAPELAAAPGGHTVPTYRSAVEFVLRLALLPLLAVSFRRHLRRSGSDVVVCGMTSLYQSLVVPLCVPRDVHYVYCVHDAHFHPGEGNPVQRLGRWLELRRADSFVCFSGDVADELRGSGVGDRPVLRTVHPAYDTQGVGSGVEGRGGGEVDGPAVVGFLGRFTPYKGIDLLPELADLLRGRGLDVRVEAHGSGEFAGLDEVLGRTGVDWHHEWIEEPDFAARLGRFDVLVLPYREASQSGVLAQALSLGVPVVATPVGGLVEQVEATGAGLVATEVSAAAVADEVARILTEPDLRATLSAAALRAAATEFSWQRVARDVATHLAGGQAAMKDTGE